MMLSHSIEFLKMKLVSLLALIVCLTAFPIQAIAQEQAFRCPSSPPASKITLQQSVRGEQVYCQAIREDGSMPFSITLSKTAGFKPRRALRKEKGIINNEEVNWYGTEIAGGSQSEIRETLIELDDDRIAHIVVRVSSPEELEMIFEQIRELRF